MFSPAFYGNFNILCFRGDVNCYYRVIYERLLFSVFTESSQKIGTQHLTALMMRVILQLEQRKRKNIIFDFLSSRILKTVKRHLGFLR